MKKRLSVIALLATLFALACALVGCGDSGTKNPPASETEYTIMYTDGEETHTITVKHGALYSIPKPLPSKEGYEFLGMFDAEEGGTQYVTASGMCVAAFTDRKNIVLFPHFSARSVTVSLEYGDAQNKGINSVTAQYGQDIPLLPAYLVSAVGDQYVFAGWYTASDCGGVKVAGADGVANKKAEDIVDADGKATLYAGFEIVTYTVTFYDCKDFSGNAWNGSVATPLEVKTVPYGSYLSDVAPRTRANGRTILSWSLTENGSAYTDEITYDQSFYVHEYALTLTYDTDGGEAIPAEEFGNRSGIRISLPAAKRSCYELIGWTCNGEPVENGTVRTGERDLVVKAQWERVAYLVTFSNYADPVEVRFGDSCRLPVPSRTGYTFVNWTDSQGSYSSIFTPEKDTELKPRWTPNSYTLTCNPDNGSGQFTATVTYGSSFAIQVPKKQGYLFDGWFNSAGVRMTDKAGNGVGKWSVDGAPNLTAHWRLAKASYKDDARKRVNDGKAAQNPSDSFTFYSLFGYTLDELKAAGFTKIKFTLTLNISEIEDGYQEVYISTHNTDYSDPLYKKTNIEHGSGKKDTTVWAHKLENILIDLNNCTETLYILYGANGKDSDDWNRESILAEMELQ